jgi:restriction endonuclease S subunit
MSDLPPGWEWVTLQDLASAEPRAITDGPFGSHLKSSHYTTAGARVIRLQNIGDGEFIDEKAYISLAHFEELSAHEAREGDLVIASLGENPPRACLIPRLTTPAIVKADCIRVRLHPEVDAKWVVYALLAPHTKSHLATRIRGVGRPRLGLNEIRRIPLPIPPLAEQQRIVATLEDHLSRLDAGVASLVESDRRIASLWRSVSSSMTLGTLDDDVTPWPSRSVGEVTAVQGGIQKQPKRRPRKNKFPFLRVANVSRGDLILREIHEIELFDDELERYRLQAGDLLVVEGNGSAEQIGRAAMWRGEIRDCVHQNHLIRVRPLPELDPRFLELVWNAPRTADQLHRVASSTSGLYTLSTAKVKSVQVPVPPIDVQQAIVGRAERWSSSITALQAAIDSARRRAVVLRQSLLADAFAGRLIPQDSRDGPASELLARIRAERLAREATRPTRRTKRSAIKRTSTQQETLL